MAFNVFFFADESMHRRYENGGGYDFVGQFAQMVYATIISQILQIVVNYLTMTDIHYYQLKEKKKNNSLFLFYIFIIFILLVCICSILRSI